MSAAVPRLDLSSIPVRSHVYRIPSRASTDPLGEAWAFSSAASGDCGDAIGLAAVDLVAEAPDPSPGR